MAGPLAVIGAGKEVTKGVNNDLIVIGTQVFRRVVIQEKRRALRPSKRHPKGRAAQEEIVSLVPVDVEVHVNPVAIGLGAIGLAAGALAAWVTWNGITVGVPTIGEVKLLPGFKDTERGQAFAEKHRLPPAGGDGTVPPGAEREVQLAACLAGCAVQSGFNRLLCEIACRARFG